MPAPPRSSRRFGWSGYLLGFGLGGFFDGILLHQILQWHHLLSLVEGVGDVRDQILFDGLFHALMYVIAAMGIGLLWADREHAAAPEAGRLLFGNVLVGFGAWHIVDSLLSHWILGIHRIRLDSPNPLAWDLIWFAAFGLLPLVLGRVLRRRGPCPGSSGGGAAALGIVLSVSTAAAWSARPPAGASSAIVLFHPDISDGAAWNAIGAAGGDVLWKSRGVWAVRWRGPSSSAPLYERGALLVSSSLIGSGCVSWTKV
ncbi:MAG: DUF2243 domain-containing protein [Pseudomonadota bacterium]|nr:DUF2243 domain-containing protein [Pseudomonadota bacterium]